MNAIEQRIASSTTNNRLHELEERQAKLERNIAIENDKKTVCLTENEIRGYYNNVLNEEPQMLKNMVAKQIVLYNEKMKTELHSPLRTGSDESRTL
jgi:hypothetical protein